MLLCEYVVCVLMTNNSNFQHIWPILRENLF